MACNFFSPSAICSQACTTCRYNTSPSGVSLIPLWVRKNSSQPSVFSNCRTDLLTAGWERNSARAAGVMPPSLATW